MDKTEACFNWAMLTTLGILLLIGMRECGNYSYKMKMMETVHNGLTTKN